MKKLINYQRRRLLKFAGLSITAAAHPPLLQAMNSRLKNTASADFHPDLEIELKLEAVRVPIFKGPDTRVWKVYGNVIKGPKQVVDNINGSYLGPTLRFQKGQKVRIYLKNNLPAESILHWHGLHVPSKMDGNPMYAINHGETYIYEFEILNRAGTYWYHAHTHGLTARQVYSGLAGLLIVHDKEEQALGLPKGQYDVPLVIQDRSFDGQNQLSYANNMMQRMQGFLGDQIMINGQPDFVLQAATRPYRLRLLNGSNSRIYKLAWDDGTPLNVIGVDGGLLEKPEKREFVMLAPAERLELWVDFSDKPLGTELTLRSIEFTAGSGMMGGMGGMGMMGGRGRMGMGRMGGGMMSHSSLPNGSDFPVVKVRIARKERGEEGLPEKLTKITALRMKDAVNRNNPKTIRLSMQHMSALLNGRSYKMNDIHADEIIPVNTLQVLEFDNGFQGMHGMGMMGMAMPHPMHLHGEQFQIIKREVNSRSKKAFSTVAAGLIDNGWKDTVLVMPGEKVTILKPFNDFKGIFMYHCHNLEHEDMGMMRDFLIR
jgi:suppressor of ftsI